VVSSQLSIEMVEMMECILLMYFNYLLKEEISLLAMGPFILRIVNAFLTMQKINEFLLKINRRRN
jgi:hypothetical protein